VSCDYQRNINSHMIVFAKCRNCPQPNETFNADANIGHGFAIFMANVGTLRPDGLRRRLTRALGSSTKYTLESRFGCSGGAFVDIERTFA